MNIDACYSKQTDNWKTPTWLYDLFMSAGYIDCFTYKSETDELKNDYKRKKLFINPPFSKLKEVANWVERQVLNENRIALLIPIRSDTEYFHKLLNLKPTILFIKGRLHYNDSKRVAPFPSILMLFNWNYLKLNIYTGITQYEIKEQLKL